MKIKKGSTIKCPLWGGEKLAKVTYVNPHTNQVSFKYKGDSYECQSALSDIILIKY